MIYRSRITAGIFLITCLVLMSGCVNEGKKQDTGTAEIREEHEVIVQEVKTNQTTATTAIAAEKTVLEEINLLIKEGRIDDALDLAEREQHNNPEIFLHLNNIAVSHIKDMSPDDVDRILLKVLEKYPNNSDVWFNHGIVLEKAGKYSEAVEAYKKAGELNPSDAEAFYLKGAVLDRLDRYDEAVEAYNQSINVKPSNFNAWFNMGVDLAILKRFDEAVEAYDKALEINPRNWNAWYNRGNAYAGLQKYQEASESYDKALELYPNNPDIWNNKGNTLAFLEKYSEALNAYNKALELSPDHPEAGRNKEKVLQKMNNSTA